MLGIPTEQVTNDVFVEAASFVNAVRSRASKHGGQVTTGVGGDRTLVEALVDLILQHSSRVPSSGSVLPTVSGTLSNGKTNHNSTLHDCYEALEPHQRVAVSGVKLLSALSAANKMQRGPQYSTFQPAVAQYLSHGFESITMEGWISLNEQVEKSSEKTGDFISTLAPNVLPTSAGEISSEFADAMDKAYAVAMEPSKWQENLKTLAGRVIANLMLAAEAIIHASIPKNNRPRATSRHSECNKLARFFNSAGPHASAFPGLRPHLFKGSKAASRNDDLHHFINSLKENTNYTEVQTRSLGSLKAFFAAAGPSEELIGNWAIDVIATARTKENWTAEELKCRPYILPPGKGDRGFNGQAKKIEVDGENTAVKDHWIPRPSELHSSVRQRVGTTPDPQLRVQASASTSSIAYNFSATNQSPLVPPATPTQQLSRSSKRPRKRRKAISLSVGDDSA